MFFTILSCYHSLSSFHHPTQEHESSKALSTINLAFKKHSNGYNDHSYVYSIVDREIIICN